MFGELPAVMLSAAKDLVRRTTRLFAALSMTGRGALPERSVSRGHATAVASADDEAGHPRTVRPRVLVLVYNPTMHSCGGKSLIEVCGYNDPEPLTRAYVEDLAMVSGSYLQYEIVETRRVDGFPRKADGFCYDEESYLRCWRASTGWHQPDAVDYEAVLREADMVGRVEAGELDELWVWAPPYGGFWESHMIGRGAFYCNSEPLQLPSCDRRFIAMGFSYERGVGEMLENFGHRAESMLTHAFGSWRDWGGSENHAWDHFTAYDLVRPGQAGCGNVHFAPNSERDYDWGNPRSVLSDCDAWPVYPNGAREKRPVDGREWGGGDIRAHHKWWLAHLPRSAGQTDGVHDNWWTYLVLPDRQSVRGRG